MDFVRKVYKPAVKIHKPVVKLFKMLPSLFKMFSTPLRGGGGGGGGARPPLLSRDDDEPLAFMTCIIKVNASKRGWQKAVLTLVRNCQGARFKMDLSGVVEISGIADPNILLKKIGKSRRIELQWFQFGQCSNNLFMPSAASSSDKKKKDPIPNPTQMQYPYDQYQYPYDQYHDPLQYHHGYPPLFNFNHHPMPIGY